MAHFVADFLPLNGTDFFDMAGEMPPQLRVYLDIPEDMDESFFKYDDAGSETERRTWFENQDKLKNILIERYRDIVKSRLQAIRRNKNLGTIGVYKQALMVDAGVMMEYDSLWGREYVSLRFAEWLVRKLMEKVDTSGEYLLILYGGNKIAYTPMGQLKKPQFAKRALGSNWSSVLYPDSVQFKFGSNAHVASVGGIEFTKNGEIKVTSIGTGGENAPQYFYFCNTALSLFSGIKEPADGRALARRMPRSWFAYNVVSNAEDFVVGGCALAGTEDKFYDQLGRTYKITNGGKIAFETSVGGSDWSNTDAMASPDGQGGWYSPTYADGQFSRMNGYNVGYTNTQAAAYYQIPNWGSASSDAKPWIYGGPGPSDTKSGSESNYNLIDRVLVYSNDGKIDKVKIETVKFTGSNTVTFTYDGPQVSGSVSYGGISGSGWQSSSGENEFRQIAGINLGTDPKRDTWLISTDMSVTLFPDGPSGNYNRMVVCRTPFGDYYKARGSDCAAPAQRAFVANGKYYLCYYHLEKTKGTKTGRISLNREDVTAVYEAALGVSANQIDYILMGVQKKDIDKLK